MAQVWLRNCGRATFVIKGPSGEQWKRQKLCCADIPYTPGLIADLNGREMICCYRGALGDEEELERAGAHFRVCTTAGMVRSVRVIKTIFRSLGDLHDCLRFGPCGAARPGRKKHGVDYRQWVLLLCSHTQPRIISGR